MSRGKIVPFNPLDKLRLGQSVAQAMFRRPAIQMERLESFEGAGIYAIYYSGDFVAYRAISERNREDECLNTPIYVGKAVRSGARKGDVFEATRTRALYNRLREHRRSIEEVENLRPEDFHCRFLVVDDIWIPLAESLLIARLNPLWNRLIDGFGNHDPGRGRHAGLRPRWDVLHPGRSWANSCRGRDETADQIASEVIEYLRSNPPQADDAVLFGDS